MDVDLLWTGHGLGCRLDMDLIRTVDRHPPSPGTLPSGYGLRVVPSSQLTYLFCILSDLSLNLKEQRLVPGPADQDPWRAPQEDQDGPRILKVWALRSLGRLRCEES